MIRPWICRPPASGLPTSVEITGLGHETWLKVRLSKTSGWGGLCRSGKDAGHVGPGGLTRHLEARLGSTWRYLEEPGWKFPPRWVSRKHLRVASELGRRRGHRAASMGLAVFGFLWLDLCLPAGFGCPGSRAPASSALHEALAWLSKHCWNITCLLTCQNCFTAPFISLPTPTPTQNTPPNTHTPAPSLVPPFLPAYPQPTKCPHP